MIDKPLLFPAIFSNPPRSFMQLIYIGVYRGKHVTEILPTDWYYKGER